MVEGQALFLFEHGDIVQKVLYQPEGAKPAADESAQQAAEQEKEAQGGKGDLEAPLILVGSTAFLVSVKNNTVITAVDSASAGGNVFTNIDGTVIV